MRKLTVKLQRSPGAVQTVGTLAEKVGIKRGEAEAMVDEVDSTMGQWPVIADQAGCTRKTTTGISDTFERI